MDTLDEILDTVLAKVGIDFSKDEEIKAEAKAAIQEHIKSEIAGICLAGMPELTPRQREYITKRLEKYGRIEV